VLTYWLTTEDRVRIEAWYVPAPAARGAVLLAHGNAGNISHSRQDDIVPFHHGERLFAAVKGPKAFLELAGGHNDGFLFTRETWREALGRFLAQHLPADAMSPVPR